MRYDYKCKRCGVIREENHGMTETPEVLCSCGDRMVKVFSVPYIGHGKDLRSFRQEDSVKIRKERSAELKEKYLIEKVQPTRGETFDNVYSNIKAGGELVKDQMQRTMAENRQKQAKKDREWKKEALKRTEKRAKEKRERRAKEESEKRRIQM